MLSARLGRRVFELRIADWGLHGNGIAPGQPPSLPGACCCRSPFTSGFKIQHSL